LGARWRGRDERFAGPSAEFSIAILDWNLPRQDGLSVLKAVRASGSALPILMITARDGLTDRVNGLDSGADDYLVKPFELAELKARLRSLLRRQGGRPSSQIVHGDLVLDPVYAHGSPRLAVRCGHSARVCFAACADGASPARCCRALRSRSGCMAGTKVSKATRSNS